MISPQGLGGTARPQGFGGFCTIKAHHQIVGSKQCSLTNCVSGINTFSFLIALQFWYWYDYCNCG